MCECGSTVRQAHSSPRTLSFYCALAINKPSYQESRPYQDFLLGDFKLLARTRLEERINQTTGNVGIRPRQLVQISHPLPFVDGLSAYLGDEVFFSM